MNPNPELKLGGMAVAAREKGSMAQLLDRLIAAREVRSLYGDSTSQMWLDAEMQADLFLARHGRCDPALPQGFGLQPLSRSHGGAKIEPSGGRVLAFLRINPLLPPM